MDPRWEMAKRSIADLRIRLLDLRNSNRLLNFKFSDRSRTHVRVIDGLPDELYEKLVNGKKLMFRALPEPEDEPEDEGSDEFQMTLEVARLSDEQYLLPLQEPSEDDEASVRGQRIERELKDRVRAQLGLPPRPDRVQMTPIEYAKRLGLDPSYDLPRSRAHSPQMARQLGDWIQTLLFPDQMERKLAGIRDGARSSLSEMGVNTLYTAFGYLEWYESEASEQKLFAPLILHPLVMEHTLIRRTYRYAIFSVGDDSEINRTLKERLLHDFRLVLPDLVEDDTPENYFARVEEAITDMKRWRVRRFVTVGLFAFSRLTMYHDLDPQRWPEANALHLHPGLVELLAGSDRGDAISVEDYETDRPEIAAKVPLLITEADSSQFSAIVDVMDGKNLAIKGPPGTGKSQTITNMIAAALAKGFKVLFVAEKMAALEVVKKRLDDAGLGEFCFELHSTKANKKRVLDSLDNRLRLQHLPDPATLEQTLKEYERLQQQLTRYVDLMNQPFGSGGKSLQQLIWGSLQAGSRAEELALPAGLNDVTFPDPLPLTALDLDRQRAALAALEQAGAAVTQTYGMPDNHPWAWVCQTDLSPFEREALIRSLGAWEDTILALEREAERAAAELGIPVPMTIDEIRHLITMLALLSEETDEIAIDLLPKLHRQEALTAVEQFLGLLQRWEGCLGSLRAKLDDPVQRRLGAERVRQLAAECRVLQIDGQNFTAQVGALPPLAQRYQLLAFQAGEQITRARRLFQSAGTSMPLTAQTLAIMLHAIDLLRSTPREVILPRTSALLDEASRPVLERGAQAASELNERQQQLILFFSFSQDYSPRQYREYAAALRRGGFFESLYVNIGLGWFADSRFKRAYEAWRGARKGNPDRAPEQMASELEQFAEHLDAIREFCDDDRLRVICGIEFRGLATDFDALLAVNDFSRTVTGKFAGIAPGNSAARQFLLEADLVALDGVLAEANEHTVAELRSFLSAFEKSGMSRDEEADLTIIPRSYLEVAATAENLSRALKSIGLREEVTMESLWTLADELESFANVHEAIEGDETVKALLGERFRGGETDRNLVARTVQRTRDLRVAGLPQHILGQLLTENLGGKLGQFKERLGSLRVALEDATGAYGQVRRASEIDEPAFFGTADMKDMPLARIRHCIQRALAARDELTAWIAYSRQRAEVEEMGQQPILRAYEEVQTPLKHIEVAFEHVFHRAILSHAYKQYPALRGFSGTSQETARRRFQELDRNIIDLKRRKLAAQLSRMPIPAGRNFGPRREWTDCHLIEHEISKRQRHIPLRDLLLRAGTAIQQMKPCWMMSPASIAQFIRPGGAEFDLVVIDEASQMKPEEALGAIARGRQLVVVGDPKQLPPTSFFERIDIPEEDEEESEDYVATESILDLALSVFRPARELRWHYRSRHESLIAFSNKHFYENNLVVFPSPTPRHLDYGVEYRNVDGLYTPKASVNLPEARAVAEAAVEFMAKYPRRSLGIATINQAQREVLSEEMDRLFARDLRAESYRKQWEDTLEPFFVKNLENVQGDDRDVIFISTVYGPEQAGGRVAQRFGPINSAVGHRRLNVLFTRAKEKVIVFSSMQAADVIPTATSRDGVKILRSYLEYASSGRLESGIPSGREPDSDFEVFVAERLRREGYEIAPQVGVAGYFIDMAIRDPRDHYNYLMGIECDGATYHSAKSARDRDRLRQEILEKLGWKVYRIWSTDWFSDAEHELTKLVRYINGLLTT